MISFTVSIIIPVCNGERYLAAAIQSVLDQSQLPDEVLVIDDGSTDRSAEIAQSFSSPVRYLHQTNLGPAAARNLGIRHATGDVLAFIDADDLWMPDKLALQLAVLSANPAGDAVLGQVENFISPELAESEQNRLAKSAAQTGSFTIGTMTIRREAFLRIGYFDTRWRHGEFIEWWARAMRLNLAHAVLPDLVLRRRLHATNLTRREPEGRREYLSMLREQLAQRRHPQGAPQAVMQESSS